MDGHWTRVVAELAGEEGVDVAMCGCKGAVISEAFMAQRLFRVFCLLSTDLLGWVCGTLPGDGLRLFGLQKEEMVVLCYLVAVPDYHLPTYTVRKDTLGRHRRTLSIQDTCASTADDIPFSSL